MRALRRGSVAVALIDAAAPEPGGSREALQDLRRALDRLDAGDRELIVLKHLDGWTYDELAARIGIPRGTVMSRLYYARQRLQSLMSGGAGGGG